MLRQRLANSCHAVLTQTYRGSSCQALPKPWLQRDGSSPPPLLHFHPSVPPSLLEESNSGHLTEFQGLKHVWAEQHKNTPLERQARSAVPRKCYFLAAAMRLE